MARKPAVAGGFYPGNEKDLRLTVKAMLSGAGDAVPGAAGAVSPHAGYVYSGATAAKAISSLGPADTFVVIGPNHRGAGTSLAVSMDDWQTPMGVVECDGEFAGALSSPLESDERAHHDEHSIEVQLPFVQYLYPDARVVCICMGDQSQGAATAVAESVLDAKKEIGRDVRVVASTDFSHYVPAETARENDGEVLSAITGMDVNGMYARLAETRASVCGFGPIAAAMEISSGLGAKKAELLEYTNSGEMSGDFQQVVGYAAVVFRA
jgi:AmmeMemoRadiSam system protein B